MFLNFKLNFFLYNMGWYQILLKKYKKKNRE